VAWFRPGGTAPVGTAPGGTAPVGTAPSAPLPSAPLPSHRSVGTAPVGTAPVASGFSRTSSSSVKWQAVDLLDAAQVHRAIAELRPSAVYHCAGAAHVGRSWGDTSSTFAINVRGTHHLLDALRRAKVPAKIVIPSSAMVYASADEALREDDPLVPKSPTR